VSESDWRIGVILGNELIFADHVAASSVTAVTEFSEVPDGAHPLQLEIEGVEFRFLVPDDDPGVERAALVKELAVLTDVVDKQLDVIDPEGAGFCVKSRNWFRRKKKRADAIDPAATLLCGERILKRLQLLRRLKELGA